MQSSWLKLYPERVSPEISFGSYQSITELVERAYQRYAHRPAVSCLGTTMTYRDVALSVERFATFLQGELQIKKGDRVAVVLPNIIQFAVVELAILKIGAVCVNTNPLYTAREMTHQFQDSGAAVVVVLDLFASKIQEIMGECALRHVIVTSIADQLPAWKGMPLSIVMRLGKKIPKYDFKHWTFPQAMNRAASHKLEPVKLELDDLALLQYTGGTTGKSKGAMLTQRNVMANMLQVQEFVKPLFIEGQEVVLTALPLYHIFALTVNFLSFFAQGQHMILVPQPVPIANTSKIFKKYRISVMTGVNTLFNALNGCETFSKHPHRHLKVAIAGGMALQEHVGNAFQALTGARVLEGFGLTEAAPATHVCPYRNDNPVGSMGIPLPSTKARVVNEAGEDVCPGEVGELIIQGPQVMKGYWKRPEETALVLRNGWLWTGDLARVNENGYFFIVDRKKDMILVSGFNVYPNEVEEVIASYPKVLEAAVVGLKDETGIEFVQAFVVKRDPSVTEDELRAHCKKQLAAYKVPRRFQFIDSLPKTNVGKILRRELRDTATQSQ